MSTKEDELSNIWTSLIMQIGDWYYKHGGSTEENRSLVRKSFGSKIDNASTIYNLIPR